MSRRNRLLSLPALLAGAALVLWTAVPAFAQEKKPVPTQEKKPAPVQEKKPTGKLEVTVAVTGGGVLESCTLYLKEQVVQLDKGVMLAVFDKVPQARYTLAGDATVRTPAGETRRHLAVQPVAVNANKTTKATLALVAVTNVEEFCSGCHPGAGDPVEKGQIVRDIHVSGKALKAKKYLDQIAKYNARVEQLTKEGQPHSLPIVLEKRQVVEGGKTVEREFFTCESCHTVHWERGDTSYARAAFRKGADLCQGCHP